MNFCMLSLDNFQNLASHFAKTYCHDFRKLHRLNLQSITVREALAESTLLYICFNFLSTLAIACERLARRHTIMSYLTNYGQKKVHK
jgi:hypothetical protein